MAERASLTIDFSKRIDIVHQVARTAVQARSVTLPQVLDSIYRGVEELFSPGVKSADFLLSSEDSRKLEYAPGATENRVEGWGNIRPILIGKGVVGRTVQSRQKVHIRSVSQEAPSPDEYIAHIDDTETSVGFPLTTPEGQVLGAFIVETAEPDAFTDLDIEILELCAQFAAIALSDYAYIEALDEAKKYAVSRAGLTALGEITGNLVHRISNDIGAAHEEIKYVLSALSPTREVKSKLSIARRNCDEVLRLVKGLLERIGDMREESYRDLHVDVEVSKAIAAIGKMPKGVKLDCNIPKRMGTVCSTHALGNL
jgi:transcriptional regulator with GAF, ATPase, and Fis domain